MQMNFFKANHKKPSIDKNFFQNYSDHLDYIYSIFQEKSSEFNSLSSTPELLHFIKDTALERLKMFEQLRDAYDYTDEILGATALPALGMLASIATLACCVWETMKGIMISFGWRNDDYTSHSRKACEHLMLAVAAFTLACASFLKSAISLVTRPIVTAVQGFAPQNKERFMLTYSHP